MDESVLAAVRDLAQKVTLDGLRESERLARLRVAGDRAEQLRAVAALADPYADGTRQHITDQFLALIGEDRDAIERINQHRQAEEIRAALADVSGAYGIGVEPTSPAQPGVAAWLNGYAQPANSTDTYQSLIPTQWVPSAATNIDQAGTGAEASGSLSIDGDVLKFHSADCRITASRQELDWMRPGLLEGAMLAYVDVALETQLVADLTTGVVASADLATAEAAVGAAWPAAADLVLCSPADRPKLRTAYAGIDPADRPRLLPTVGCTTGTAIVMASSGVFVEASRAEWMTQDNPTALGKDLAVLRWARAQARTAGAVQTVTVA